MLFNPKVADVAAQYVEKVRINPGNYVDAARTFKHLEYTDEEYAQELQKIHDRFVPFLNICKENHTAIRIGVNHGSLSDRIMSRYGDTPEGMVESCMEFLRICVKEDFTDVVISIKASNTVVMVKTVRLLAAVMEKEGMQFPLHLGVTEAGDGEDGKEIDKYTGNLMPLNFKAVAADLKKKGRLHLAEGNLMASGKLATILYKEEIERALKTPGFSGFQLLDLHDFPGQGTALVGIIDAFWESKGLITPEEFRNFCSPVVPLARFEKATYVNNETFNAQFEAANFSDKVLSDIQPEWRLSDSKGTVIAQGNLDKQEIPVGNAFNLGSISVPLESISVADQLTLSIRFTGTQYQNSWNVWVYPQEVPEVGKEIFYTRSFADAEKALSQGKKVLLNPEKEEINGLEGKFVQVFWSPVHFPNQPGTMGILCDPAHPALVDFPTEMHSNWQWWDICKNATTMELDSLKNNMQPIVRMVR